MKIQSLIRFSAVVFLAAPAFLVASSASAGATWSGATWSGVTGIDANGIGADSIDEGRTSVELEADLKQSVDRVTNVVNTALTFHNPGRGRAIVVCAAYDGNGNLLGTKAVHIPPRGLRYLRASDIAYGVDFVGTAECKSRSRVRGSAILLAPGALTNLDVRHSGRSWVTFISFPLVVSY